MNRCVGKIRDVSETECKLSALELWVYSASCVFFLLGKWAFKAPETTPSRVSETGRLLFSPEVILRNLPTWTLQLAVLQQALI